MLGRLRAVLPLVLVGACYAGGNGSAPPLDGLNFPVGIAVSKGGGVLYVANADFDLQYNGGTIQTYDLNRLRRDVVSMIAGDYVDCASTGTFKDIGGPIGNFDRPGCLPLIHGKPMGCPNNPQQSQPDDASVRVPLGQTCAPPVQASHYVKKGAIIGAFATGVHLAPDGTRIFIPVRGNASLTWADVTADVPDQAPGDANFAIDCGQRPDMHCDPYHAAGNNPPAEPNNTRQVTMPGEPFGLAFNEDGTAAVVTHQTDTKVSLFDTGLGMIRQKPSLQFVLDGVPAGGIGVAPVPHRSSDCTAADCPPSVRPSFLLTSRQVAQVALLRYYDDTGADAKGSSLLRPFLVEENVFGLNAAAGGTDSRGVVIDPTPRLKCLANVDRSSTRPKPDIDADIATCNRLPARVFIANRTPASLVVGEIGNVRTDGTYDPDFLTLFANVPLVAGPSNIYLAPIVDRNGNYAVRLFAVCYDAQAVLVIDPETRTLENVIRTGPGPFAMAFDPFDLNDIAIGKPVEQDKRWPDVNLRKYRFAYIASFLQSYIQVVDLDGSRADKSTFETIVYNLGAPTIPKGS